MYCSCQRGERHADSSEGKIGTALYIGVNRLQTLSWNKDTLEGLRLTGALWKSFPASQPECLGALSVSFLKVARSSGAETQQL